MGYKPLGLFLRRGGVYLRPKHKSLRRISPPTADIGHKLDAPGERVEVSQSRDFAKLNLYISF